MRHWLAHRIRDDRGVTILMALFALLVAAMVSMVILSAAVSTVKQAAADKEYEQDMLTLQSAGDLISSEVSKVTCNYTITSEGVYDNGSWSYHNPSLTALQIDQDCFIEAELTSAVRDAVLGANDVKGKSFVVKLSATDSERDVSYAQDVAVDFVLRKDGYTESGKSLQLVFTLKLKEGGAVKRTLYLTLSKNNEPVGSTEDKNGTTSIREDNYRLSWYGASYSTVAEGENGQ